MPTGTEELLIVVRLKDAASQGLRALATGVSGVRGAIDVASNALFSFKGLLAGIGAGVVARQFVGVASSFEDMQIKLDALTKGKGVETLERINEWAKTMPVNTQQAVSTFAMMRAMGLDPTIEKMQTLVDTSVLFGEDAMPRIARALGQMATLGRLSGEELNQLSEVGINARKYITQAFGKTVEEVQRSGIEITKVVDAIWNGLNAEFGGSAERARTTWRGMMVELQSYWTEFARQVMGSGVFDYIKAGISIFLDLIRELEKSGKIADLYKQTADTIIAGFEVIVKGAALVGDAFRGWQMIWYSLKSIYAEFSAWLVGMLEADARNIDSFLTSIENMVKAVGDAFNYIEEASHGMLDFGFDEALQNFDSLSGAMDDTVASLENAKKFWTEIAIESEKNLQQVAGQESYYSKVDNLLQRIRDKAKEIGEAQKKGGTYPAMPERPTGAAAAGAGGSAYDQARADLTRFQADAKQIQQAVEDVYAKGEISLEDYYNVREGLAREQYEKEIALLNMKLEAEKKISNKVQLQAEIYAREQQFQGDLLQLTLWRLEEEKKAEQRKQDLTKEAENRKLREIQAGAGGGEAGLQAQFQQELIELDQRHREEIQRLRDLKATEAEINEAYRIQELEKEKLFTEQRKRLYESVLTVASQTAGDLATVFKTLWEGSGKDQKRYFKIYKAAAIAQAIIDTYKSATSAFSALAGIQYVGPVLGAAAAAAAIATGMARVAAIRAQEMAGGGPVQGTSPHSKADNIPIWATAGEFMHPVDTVKYYGRGVMEALRKKAIPKEMLTNFSIPVMPKGGAFFASGGGVTSAATAQMPTPDSGGADNERINITNVVDPNLMGQYLGSRPGERQVINIISQNSNMVKTALFSRDG